MIQYSKVDAWAVHETACSQASLPPNVSHPVLAHPRAAPAKSPKFAIHHLQPAGALVAWGDPDIAVSFAAMHAEV